MKERELIRRSIAEKFKDLPEFSAAILPGNQLTVMIRRGEIGYWPLQGADVDDFNRRRNVTAAQAAAMLTGSMFGWDAPGSDPLNYVDTPTPADTRGPDKRCVTANDVPDIFGTANFD